MGARLSYMEGMVLLTREKTRLPAELNMALLPGDTVETGKDSQAEVTLEDSSTIELDPETRFGIIDLSKDSASGQRAVKTDLMSGELKARIVKLAQKSTFEIESPTAVAAVRGTEFTMAYREGQPTQVTVLAGKVAVSPPGKPAYVVLVPEHSRILVKLGERPGRLLRLAPQDEQAVQAKWQQWTERRDKALGRLKPKPQFLGPEIPKPEPGSKLEKANVSENRKAALEKRPGARKPGLGTPKARTKAKTLKKTAKPGAEKASKKPQPKRKKP